MFSKSLINLCRQRLYPTKVLQNVLCKRSLYERAAIGLDKYEFFREKIQNQFSEPDKQLFRERMNSFADPESNSLIFTEDLKQIVHMAGDNETDLTLVEKMMKKYNKQNQGLRFGNFTFGPVVMRMYYHLNKPDIALKLFNDPEMDGFFNHLSSYQILMDLLFINGKFDEILTVYKSIQERQLQIAKFPKGVMMLVFAACYKLNTTESFEYACKLWSDQQEAGHSPIRKTITFFAANAINQNSPHIALEVITSVRNQSYVTLRNIKVVALCDLGRIFDALPLLRSVLSVDQPMSGGPIIKQTYCRDVINLVKSAAEKHDDKELSLELDRILNQLEELNMISETTLDSLLCSEIKMVERLDTNNRESVVGASYQSGRPFKKREFRRPGITDLL
ncbi:pentatricopeptide repeat-containing protein 2, mitochondrial-like isoform X1 [Aphis gossypii]|uniref:pentatricopeptide repeat-containing protein 2, mitochondrial-like isoform X1 n=2 Tax=Aphis gossypii TaxID=80765 RepID=UPI0021596E33|nr:pentatricopeptide repeat-containing protein 2, mitochondrial-like isoform X1 [Aphis gossypii]XP_050066825.1 pentatricopeptide repeat-containing protein 2, mitochondrial-like isoform X1 [Aphis gossypii]